VWHAGGMQAVTVPEPGGPDQLSLADRPVPEPRADEALIRVVAAGINRADLLQRQGHYPPPPGASDVLGMECSGYVTALGPDADDGRWAVGDPCLALLSSGGYAEYVAAPVGQLLSVPDGVDLVTAAGLVEVAATVVWLASPEAASINGQALVLDGGGIQT